MFVAVNKKNIITAISENHFVISGQVTKSLEKDSLN